MSMAQAAVTATLRKELREYFDSTMFAVRFLRDVIEDTLNVHNAPAHSAEHRVQTHADVIDVGNPSITLTLSEVSVLPDRNFAAALAAMEKIVREAIERLGFRTVEVQIFCVIITDRPVGDAGSNLYEMSCASTALGTVPPRLDTPG